MLIVDAPDSRGYENFDVLQGPRQPPPLSVNRKHWQWQTGVYTTATIFVQKTHYSGEKEE